MSVGAFGGFAGYASIVRTPFFWICLLDLVLGVLAYYAPFFPPDHRELSAQGERFFFEPNEAAGAPVLILSIWLFYRRSHLRDILWGQGEITTGLMMWSLAAALYCWAVFTSSKDIQLVSLIPALTGIALFLGGRSGVRAYWLPILFLGFAIPISPVLLAALLYPAQLLTAQFSGLILNALGVASIVQGDQILRPENTFVVIETCSGVRTIVTLSMLTVLLIDLFERRGLHAAILIVTAPFIAFLVNGLRVVTLVLNPHSSIHAIHNLQGIAMLLVGLVMIYLLDGRLEWFMGTRTQDVASPVRVSISDGRASRSHRTIHMILVASFLLAMLAFNRFGPNWKLAHDLEEKPGDLMTRVFGEDPSSPYVLDYNFAGSVHYLAHARHRIEVDDGAVEIHIGVANEQLRQSSILTKRLAWPKSGYAAIDESFVEIAEGGPVVRRMTLRRGARQLLSYSWIERRGPLLNEWLRHALALDRSPFIRSQRMLAIRISTALGPSAEGAKEADRRIRRTWHHLAPHLSLYAPSNRTTRQTRPEPE